MMLRLPLRPETVKAAETLPAALRALQSARTVILRSELADVELSRRFPEPDDRMGFLACRRELREAASDNFGLGFGVVVDGALDWSIAVERAALRGQGGQLPGADSRFLAVAVTKAVAELANREAARRMGEEHVPLQDHPRIVVEEAVAMRIHRALQDGVTAYQEWTRAVEAWDGYSVLPTVALPAPKPVPGAAPSSRWTIEKVLGAWVDDWMASMVPPSTKLLRDPLAVMVDGKIRQWVSLFWRAPRAGASKDREWTPEQEKWIRAKVRERRANESMLEVSAGGA